MRISSFTSYRLWLGGGERLCYNLVNHVGESSTHYSHKGGIKYTDSPKFATYKDYSELNNIVRANKDDVVIVHDPGMMAMEVMFEVNKLLWYAHGAYVFNMDVSSYARPFACISNYAPNVVHPSWSSIPILPIRLGVDENQFNISGDNSESHKLIVGVVGRISPEKIPLFWFDFVRKFNREHPISHHIEFHIYGKGDTPTDYYKQFISHVNSIHNIKYVNDLPINSIQNAYHSFDCLMVPSLTETGSYAIVEAQMCGLEVYALNSDGIPFHMTPISHLCKDYDDMFNKLGTFSKKRNHKFKMDQRSLAIKDYSLDKWVSKITKLIDIAFY